MYLFDFNKISADELLEKVSSLKNQNPNVIAVANKADLFKKELHKQFIDEIFISAKEQTGIDELKNTLFAMGGGASINNENVIVTNARHYAALREISKSLQEIKVGLSSKISGDLLSIDINRCLHFIGEITGEVTNEDRLDYIFSKFCIGK